MDTPDEQNNISADDELAVCKKQAEEYLNNWKRERADFINYKKDESKRVEEFIKFGNESLILELFEPLDNLYLAVKEFKNEGLDKVIAGFEDFFKKIGVERIKIGDKFDPMFHEVVEGTEGEKVEEVRAGYTMYGRVIRPARVKIIK